MSEPPPPARPFYVTGGTLKPGEPSYVERRADTELFESLLRGLGRVENEDSARVAADSQGVEGTERRSYVDRPIARSDR